MKITDIANVPEGVVMVTPDGFDVRWSGDDVLIHERKDICGSSYAVSRSDITGTWRLESEPAEKTVTITIHKLGEALESIKHESHGDDWKSCGPCAEVVTHLLAKKLGFE